MGDQGETPASSPFAPRASLVRSPPSGAPLMPTRSLRDVALTPSVRPPPAPVRQRSTPPQSAAPELPPSTSSAPSTRRPPASPAERRPVDVVRMCHPTTYPAPPPAFAEPSPAPSRAPSPDLDQPEELNSSLSRATKVELLDRVHGSLQTIMEAVTASSSRLNKDSINSIGAGAQDTLAVVAALSLRLCEMEAELGRAKVRQAELERDMLVLKSSPPRVEAAGAPAVPTPPSYSAALKLSKKADPVLIPVASGPILAFYPAQDKVDILKTAEDTKAELKRAVDPRALDVQVERLRKVGNAGVIVETTSSQAAERLKKAVPSSLRVSEPKQLSPRVCIRDLDGNPTLEDFTAALWEQNFKDTDWTLERLRAQSRCYKMKGRRVQTSTLVMECSPELREALLGKGRLYIGWQSVEACDFIRVTCCNKCQSFGHPEKYCRASEVVCGKCGATGHKKADCKEEKTRCATCHRFGREAESHSTNARSCPARLYAEQRAVATTNYGCP